MENRNDGERTLRWWVERRAEELNLTLTEVAHRAGLRRQALWRIFQVESMRPSTRGKLEEALGWETGSITEVKRGGDPTPRELNGNGNGHGNGNHDPELSDPEEQELWESLKNTSMSFEERIMMLQQFRIIRRGNDR
jgi:transcriptional regulator with XRE-family HTH domain